MSHFTLNQRRRNLGQEVEACWICGGTADSAEHRLKRSDARATFGTISQKHPIFLHADEVKNARVQTVNAPALKFRDKLCEDCNTRRTQPFDRAWDRLAKALRRHETAIAEAGGFDFRTILSGSPNDEMLKMHLFFVKLTLGQIVMSGSSVDREPFRQALMNVSALNSLFLKFCIYEDDDPSVFAGQSDVHEWRDPETSEPVGLAWAYIPGAQIELQGLWTAKDRELDGAWRPNSKCSWVPIHFFPADE